MPQWQPTFRPLGVNISSKKLIKRSDGGKWLTLNEETKYLENSFKGWNYNFLKNNIIMLGNTITESNKNLDWYDIIEQWWVRNQNWEVRNGSTDIMIAMNENEKEKRGRRNEEMIAVK